MMLRINVFVPALFVMSLAVLPALGMGQNITLSPALDPGVAVRIFGNYPNSVNYRIIIPVGDFNGDGIDDAAFGNPMDDDSGALVLMGKEGAWTDLDFADFETDNSRGFKVNCPAEVAGIAMAPVGDFNGDGFADFMIGSWGGKAYIIFGKRGPLTNLSTDEFASSNVNGIEISGGGKFISSAGDFNGDGYDDILINRRVPDPDYYNAFKETMNVVFGRDSSGNIDLNVMVSSDSSGFRIVGPDLDATPAPAGDYNHDGYDDIMIGGYSGSRWVLFGKPSGQVDVDLHNSGIYNPEIPLDGVMIRNICGGSGPAYIGDSDYNGDGISDLLIPSGCYINNPPDHSGAVYVAYGETGTTATISGLDFETTNTRGYRIWGPDGEAVGEMVCNAGDVNGDGISDILVPARSATYNPSLSGWSSTGSTYVVYGRPGNENSDIVLATADIPGSVGFRIDGAETSIMYGPVSAVGDLNNDGYDDIAMEGFVPGAGDPSGENYIIFGKPTFPAAVPDWEIY